MDDSRHNFGDIIETHLPVSCGRLNANGSLISANKRWIKLFDSEKPMLPEFQPNGRLTVDYLRSHLDEALRKGESSFEIYANKPSGNRICVAVTLKSEEDGTYIACVNEITHYKDSLEDALKREQEAFELNKILVDSAPFVLNLFDDELNLLTTSDYAVTIFELESKQQYIDNFMELSPEFQPCGTPSAKKAKEMLAKAFNDGRNIFEWMHQTSKGEPLPMEIVAVRFKRSDKYMIAAYATDLRSVKAVLDSEKRPLTLRGDSLTQHRSLLKHGILT